ncbi:MAG: TIR domain-containing protein [Planctomycetaceae bacterium]|nr:TIR domain-containing protein [Planctomycetaceae bacterium]MCB9951832.1 TIR domain-containing protein [Planctomycetaceae bacterium]
MTYSHHAFISYCWFATKHRPREQFRYWVCNSFKPLLEEHLIRNLSGFRSVFVDQDCKTEAGYRNQIAEAYHKSAVLIPILDSQYFDSPWCRAEWAGFVSREQQTGNSQLIYSFWSIQRN